MKQPVMTKGRIRPLNEPVGIAVERDRSALIVKADSCKTVSLYLAKEIGRARSFGRSIRISVVSASGREQSVRPLTQANIAPCVGGHLLTYVERGKKTDRLLGAFSKNFRRFVIAGKIATAQERGVLVPNYQCADRHVLYFGAQSVRVAISRNLKRWNLLEGSPLAPRPGHFDHGALSVLAVSASRKGILALYDASCREGGRQILQVGAALFSLSDPMLLLWRSAVPLWRESRAARSVPIHSVGAAIDEDGITLYFSSPSGRLKTVTLPQPYTVAQSTPALARLKRFVHNPIIVPNVVNEWESDATFNPAALYDQGKVHLLYRAVGRSGLSCLGYASTKDGVRIDETLPEPAYVPREKFEGVHTKPSKRTDLYKSGCGWGGCEDPKLTALGDKVYLTYVAYSGYSHPRVALSSISRSDFAKKRWNWDEPALMSAPGVVDKSACLLPEQVKGKYVIFHRVFPHILIDYRSNLTFDNGRWLRAHDRITTRPGMWDSRKLSVGATPIKTDDGWLVIYHAVDDRDDTRYKVGAMILDLKDPARVLYRTSAPILEPEETYENEGKPGVVYPCGAVVIGPELFVYYGGGDRVVCCATVRLKQFLDDLKRDRPMGYTLKGIGTVMARPRNRRLLHARRAPLRA